MYLRHEAKRNNNLVWNNQLGTNTWEGERTILDSKNYTDYIPNSAAAVSVEENSTEFGLIFTLPSSSVGVISTGYGVIVAGSIDGSNFASSDIIEYASPVYILNTPYTS